MKDHSFDFSVVMSVYNVENYLREAVESLVHQSIGFDRIQLIMVDDGSTDGSGAICDEYGAKYPDNVMVIHKENGGLSSARNTGLPHVAGKYVSFFDPDDILDRDVMEKVGAFMDVHDEVDVSCIPYYTFGLVTGPHYLNDKFDNGTRVIDLSKDENAGCILISSATAFYRKSIARDLCFDTRLCTAEDIKANVSVLINNPNLGVISDTSYHYRKHGTSISSNSKFNHKYYLSTLNHFSGWAMDYAMEQYGRVPQFVQNMVMCDLQWRLLQSHIPEGMLQDKEAEEYRRRLFEITCRIDDDVILAQKNLAYERKLYLLSRKHGGFENYVRQTGTVLEEILALLPTYIHFMRFESNQLVFEGRQVYVDSDLQAPEIYITINGRQEIRAEEVRYKSEVYSADVEVAQLKAFQVAVPLEIIGKEAIHIGFVCRYGAHRIEQREIITSKYAPVSTILEHSYYRKGVFLLQPERAGFVVRRSRQHDVFGDMKREIAFLKELFHTEATGAKKAVACRLLYHALRPFCPKDIWLVADRADRADDNGEAFFRYLVSLGKESGCHPIFAIGKDSPDYPRMKKIGRVVPYLSWRHKLIHLMATHTISAYSHNEISSPFYDYSYFYGDILQQNRVVFLQHGITKDDVSSGLNRYNKNYALFVTAVKPEYDSIVNGNYAYRKDQVVLTGFPRYDRLYNDTKKIITIMPTWSHKLVGKFIPEESRWELLPGFEESDYYRMYSALLNDERLLVTADALGYTVRFLIHPVFGPYVDRFKLDKRVVVLHRDVHYRDVFAESALITTDYSSVAFDFAYLKKPVVYTQFTDLHYERGYFSYERDGFGEIENTVEGAVERLIEYMEHDCQLKPEYRERIDRFFMFHDQNNCKRVYDAIVNLDKEG